MEFRVDIKGDTSGATQGAAALRDEAAAARQATAAIATVGRSEAALSSTSRSAEELAHGLKEAQREASALKAARDAASSGPSVDVAVYRSLSEQIEAATSRASDLAAELAKTGRAGEDFAGNEARAKAAQTAEAQRAKAAEQAAKEKQKQEEKASAAARKTREELKGAGKEMAENLTGALRYGAALAGIGGLGELTKLAIGWRGMAALQMISMRATLDVRRLFVGLDSAPLVRAADRLERNLSRSTVTGSALSAILQRGFTSFFNLVERGEPLLTSMFEGAIIGAQEAEIAWLKAKISLAPLIVAAEDWLGSEDAMETAAYAGAAALATIGVSAAVAAVPVLALVAAFASVGKAINEAVKLYREWDGNAMRKAVRKTFSFGLIDDDAAKGPGAGEMGEGMSKEEIARFNAARRAAVEADEGRDAAAQNAGVGTGRAMADGIVVGMSDREKEVAAGAGRLVDVANTAARSKAQAHSPAERFRKGVGRDIGSGVAVGIDDQADTVQRAADRSLVPDQPKVGGAAAGAGGGANVVFNYSPQYNFHGGPPRREDLEAADRQGFRQGLRELTIAMGLPLPKAAT